MTETGRAAGSPSGQAPLPLGLTTGRRTIALAVVLIAFFMDLLDVTIVNVAIPSIRADLGASYSAIQWIVAGYALAFAVLLITGGRLGDIYGYKPLFLAGVGAFTAASAFCGLAPSTELLIGARFLQGVAAAMMVPQILSLIQVMYTTPAERRNVTAAYGAAAGLATVLGPIVGGILINAELFGLGWRAIFLVNVPVGVLGLYFGIRYLPSARSQSPLRVDTVGVVLVIVAMLLLMYPLIQGRQLGWPWWTFALMAASVPAFVFFAISQRVKERQGASPLVVTELFAERTFVAGTLVILTFFAVVAGYFLVQQLWLQAGLGYPVLKAGLTGIPFSIGIAISAGLAGPVLVPRLGRWALTIGAVIMMAGYSFTVWTSTRLEGAVEPWDLIPGLFMSGIGMGLVVAPVFGFVLAAVPVRHAGSASGIINAVGQIGGAIGVAIIGVVFFNLIDDHAPPSANIVSEALRSDLAELGVPGTFHSTMIEGFNLCFADTAAADDPAIEPESCRQGREELEQLAQFLPTIDPEAVLAAMEARGLQANQRTFSRSFETTLLWAIGGLLLVFALSFLLPRRPIEDANLGGI